MEEAGDECASCNSIMLEPQTQCSGSWQLCPSYRECGCWRKEHHT